MQFSFSSHTTRGQVFFSINFSSQTFLPWSMSSSRLLWSRRRCCTRGHFVIILIIFHCTPLFVLINLCRVDTTPFFFVILNTLLFYFTLKAFYSSQISSSSCFLGISWIFFLHNFSPLSPSLFFLSFKFYFKHKNSLENFINSLYTCCCYKIIIKYEPLFLHTVTTLSIA